MRQSWVPILASLLPSYVTSLSNLTSLTLNVFIYKMGIFTEPRPYRNVQGVRHLAQDGAQTAVNTQSQPPVGALRPPGYRFPSYLTGFLLGLDLWQSAWLF